MANFEHEIPDGTKQMLQRFAHPQGESGNPLIGAIVKVLEGSDGTSPITSVVEETHLPPQQILGVGEQLRGVFEISGENLSFPSIQGDIEQPT